MLLFYFSLVVTYINITCFLGNVSTTNNGGFTSVRTKVKVMTLMSWYLLFYWKHMSHFFSLNTEFFRGRGSFCI